MKYEHMMPAVFQSRPNRFIAYAKIGNLQVTCHVKNTGRCRELLVPGAPLFLQHHPNAAALGRKTEYSVICVRKETDHGSILINMDSQAPNQAAYEWLCSRGISPKREVRFGNSRFDLAFEENGVPAFMEVKGVTLEEDGIARFPDAPTERGVKHLQELVKCREAGFEAYVLSVIQMKGVRYLEPNDKTHPAFGEALRRARQAGVKVLAYDCRIRPDEIRIEEPVEVRL